VAFNDMPSSLKCYEMMSRRERDRSRIVGNAGVPGDATPAF
jgi:hypothetical protein